MSVPAVVYAPGALGSNPGKTANDLVIYDGLWFKIVAVVDPSNAGRDAGEVVGVGRKGIPVVPSLEDAFRFNPKAFIIGVAPVGGVIPESWMSDIRLALANGLDVYSGMHVFLSDNKELVEIAERYGARIYDVRKPGRELFRIWDGSVLRTGCTRILVAGTDCCVGKNIACIELYKELERRGVKTGVVGTGQTMLLLGAKGAVIDAIPADFAPGVVERFVVEACNSGCKTVVVEGQGAVLHPAYGQVTLSILYGASPTHIVLCHHPGRKMRTEFKGIPMPEPEEEAEMLLRLNPYKKARLAGVCINTTGMSKDEAARWKKELGEKLGAPVVDPLRDGVSVIVDAVLKDTES